MDDETRRSWNVATRNHNAHKGDQAAFFRAGGDVLFSEELELLGPLQGRDVVHLQCNAGQDSLSLAQHGARVTGVDFADEAIAFARQMSVDSGVAATFVESEIITWLEGTPERFDLAFTSYGTTPWLADLDAWARGVERVLRPGGALVYVEFHPLIWSLGQGLDLRGDDYFAETPFLEPVGDYVAASGAALGAQTIGSTTPNTIPATSYQRSLGDIVTAIVQAGLRLEVLREHGHSNGLRYSERFVALEGRRFALPPEVARVPLMFSLRARKPD